MVKQEPNAAGPHSQFSRGSVGQSVQEIISLNESSTKLATKPVYNPKYVAPFKPVSLHDVSQR